MKKAIVAAAASALFLAGLAAWHAAAPPAPRMQAKASQIYIHGTPVCVMERGGEVVARVGECGRLPAPGEDGPFGGAPFAGEEGGANLPPGHPPVPRGFPQAGGQPLAI